MGKSVKVPKGCGFGYTVLVSKGRVACWAEVSSNVAHAALREAVGRDDPRWRFVPVAIVPLTGEFRIVPVKRAKAGKMKGRK